MDMMAIGIIGGILLVLVIWLVVVYNGLVKHRNRYENLFSQIDIQLKRRHDLIPNLVSTAKSYMEHERETLSAVTEARNGAERAREALAANPGSAALMGELQGAEQALAGAMGKFNMVMEAYPDLKANQNMMQLSEELVTTENRVAFARQGYNDQVMVFNTARQNFPAVMVAGMLGFGKDAPLLEFEDRAEIQQAPKVSF